VSESKPQSTGDKKVEPGAELAVGYDFSVPGKHPATDVLFVDAKVTFEATCAKGGGGGTITVSIPNQVFQLAEDEKGWHPSGDKQSDLVFQGSTTVPDLCRGQSVRLGKGQFSARILSTTPVELHYRWHYDANDHADGWGAVYIVTTEPVL
jgi:hypothetical protein